MTKIASRGVLPSIKQLTRSSRLFWQLTRSLKSKQLSTPTNTFSSRLEISPALFSDAGGSTTSSYGFIQGSTTYAGGSVTSSTTATTSTSGVAKGSVIMGGSILQVGGSNYNQTLPILQVEKNVVTMTDQVLRDLLHFGVPPVQVSPSGANTVIATLTTQVINGRCSCFMEDANGNLAKGLEIANFYVFIVYASNESVVTYASVTKGSVTTLSGLKADTNYKVKYYIEYSTVWFEISSETSITTSGGAGGGGAGGGAGGGGATPTPSPGSPAAPGVFSTPKEGSPSGIRPPVVTRNPDNPNMVDVKFTIPKFVTTPTATPGPTLAPGVTTGAGGAVPTTAPSTVTTSTSTPAEEEYVYTVTRGGIAIFNGTSRGGEMSFTSPYPNENDLVGDVFQLTLCNSKGCVHSPIAVTPPKSSVPGRPTTGVLPRDPLPTGKLEHVPSPSSFCLESNVS